VWNAFTEIFSQTYEYIDLHNGAVTAVATVLLAGITFGLAYVARLQIITSRAQLRAYLAIDRATLINFDSTPTVQVLIKNAGQTPTHVVAWNAVVTSRMPLDINRPRPPDADIIRSYLGPGMAFHMTTRLDPFEDHLRTQIRERRIVLQVFGRADYVDAFGKNRFLAWQLYYGLDTLHRPDGMLGVNADGNKGD
jgi:hypothetical protein